MIDRVKVIKALDFCIKASSQDGDPSGYCYQCPYRTKGDLNEDGKECVEVLMDDSLAILKEQEWHILTEDADGIVHGLPGDDGQYLMTDGKDIWIDDYVDGVDDGVWLDSDRDIREIKAWMYMPKLPILD